jgi:hypothetical protein
MENEEKDPEAPGEEQRIGPLGKKAIDEAEAAMGLAGGARADIRSGQGAPDQDPSSPGGDNLGVVSDTDVPGEPG